MYQIISKPDPASVPSGNADRTHAYETNREIDRRQRTLDSYVPYVDYVPGRDV